MRSEFSYRWLAVGVFIISSTLNYVDRQLLNVLAPLLMAEFHFNQAGFGALVSIFSIAYASVALLTGWLLDRFGVNRAISAAVGWWSLAAISTGLVQSVSGLGVCRALLGIGESAGVPAVGKLNGLYLKPGERALGAAVNQIGLSVGAAIAPLWIGVAIARGWRTPFVVNGFLGFIWIPIWLFTSRRIRPRYAADEIVPPEERKQQPAGTILRDRNLLILVVSNILWMGGYSLWSNWTTLYLVHVHHITLAESARYVWIPPLVSNLGGFFGGWLSLRWVARSIDPVAARRRATVVSAACSLVTLTLPLAPDAAWATAIISLSFFFALAGSVNIYALPIDIFGAGRTGLAIAALTFAFGVLQTVISPVIGFLADRQLYTAVLWIVTVPMVLGALVLFGLRTSADRAATGRGVPA